MKSLEEMRELAAGEFTGDPTMDAPLMMAHQGKMAQALKAMGAPNAVIISVSLTLFEEQLIAFKTKVTNDLLASQKETSDALAAALNMRGRK